MFRNLNPDLSSLFPKYPDRQVEKFAIQTYKKFQKDWEKYGNIS